MSADEISEMKKTLRFKSRTWIKAFETYNSAMKEQGERELKMECASCWFKVLKFHESKLVSV